MVPTQPGDESMERTIVVGDVHGCREELEELVVDACRWRPGERVVLVGDLVAKGPDSPGVVRLARQWRARAVCGNHDARVLRLRDVQHGKLPPDSRPVKPEHQLVVDTLQPEDFAYLDALPYFLSLGPERAGAPDTLVVHGGLVPGVSLEEQDPEMMMNLRSIQEDGTPTKKLKGRPWAAVWGGPERVVFGHDAVRGYQSHSHATGLDTGCVYGGKLTALVLPERRLVSVSARRAYVSMSG